MANQIDQLAGKLERSKSWIIKQALASWIEQESLRERLTREGLADVDEGNFVSHDDIQAWAMSLNSNHPSPLQYDQTDLDKQGNVRPCSTSCVLRATQQTDSG